MRCDRVTAEAARSTKFFFHDGDDDRRPAASLNDAIRGRDDWAGAIDFREEALSGPQVAALAKVIKRVDADVIVLNEVEDRRTLEAFNAQSLGRRYAYAILFEGNDARGIDIGVLSKHPVIALRTNVFTADPAEPKRRDGSAGRLFERDCLELAIALPDGAGELGLLATHFKSKRGRDESDTDPKRLRQSAEIARIVAERYAKDGRPRRVVVAGDLNERPDRNGANGARLGPAKTSIDPLLVGAGLSNVVGEALKDGAWTYLADGLTGRRGRRSTISCCRPT